MVLILGELDLLVVTIVFLLSAISFSYPAILERLWQSKHLPPDTTYISVEKIKKGPEFRLLDLFDLPQIYGLIKNRYSLRMGDSNAPGLFLYFYLPPDVYEVRNVGPETVYKHLAGKLKEDTGDISDVDLIAQRHLPLAFGYRFIPKQGFQYHELSRIISIVRKEYFRENTKIRGVLQSRRRIFRLHSPDDNEWRTFQPYQEDSKLLFGGATLAHDFRSNWARKLRVHDVSNIEAERVEYPESIPFGSLLTYAKKGEITLEGTTDAVDKLYIDRVNVLVYGTEHRKEILQQLSEMLKKEVSEDDLYPLFNYGQRLRGYMDPGKSVSDFVSSHGNFALYYDPERGWTVIKLEPRLRLFLKEAYWNSEPRAINGQAALTTSRANLISGPHDAPLQFQISTGTPTRGQIFAADEMIENKIKSFAQMNDLQIVKQIGSGAEGCLYLAEKDSNRYYLKSPDGQLLQEEVNTIENLKRHDLIPKTIKAYPEDRMIVLPEFLPLPRKLNGLQIPALALIFRYLKNVYDLGYLCLDLTPDHIRMDPREKKIFLIDFSGYVRIDDFNRQPEELLADRKKIEYRTPEESLHKFHDPEKFQIYLIGLLFYQLSHHDYGLPLALKALGNGSGEYDRRLADDVKGLEPNASVLQRMLAYQPSERKDFAELQQTLTISPEQVDDFWKKL